MEDLSKDFHYYLENQQELLKQYEGRYLIIVGCKVVGDYIDMAEAVRESQSRYGLGNFLLQYCSQGNRDYTMTFHNSYIRF